MKEKFLTLCRENIHREGIDKLLAWLEKSDFFTAPASTRFHGAHEGGLVEHSLNVYEQLTNGEPTETTAIISLFHDLCKTDFYTVRTAHGCRNRITRLMISSRMGTARSRCS